MALGDPLRAVTELEAAMSLPSTGDPNDDAEIAFTLARALVAAGRTTDRAVGLARQARDTFQASARTPRELRTLERAREWLQTYEGAKR